MGVHDAIIKIRLGPLINLEHDCGSTKEEKHLFQDGLNEWGRLTLTAVIYGLLIIHHGYKTILIGQFKRNHYMPFINYHNLSFDFY